MNKKLASKLVRQMVESMEEVEIIPDAQCIRLDMCKGSRGVDFCVYDGASNDSRDIKKFSASKIILDGVDVIEGAMQESQNMKKREKFADTLKKAEKILRRRILEEREALKL